ncbi:TspO/MBR family protein [Marinobacterium sedimentorum]|uniref:TspO/MBR family protein n=1 Tax=Marinobacterium sedimentorum TaxID=2927804 RepID=UPI0020C63580|nr:TspO/MBR family protein [Marinobacterium sedimentorum]MCP8688915.1 tryptophan-rich sensory protein [Marinobacterium sedimentorum]
MQIPGLLGWLLVSFVASGIGTVASVQARAFYSQLAQPEWAPPGGLFGPVWATLYALMGIASLAGVALWRISSQPAGFGFFLAAAWRHALWSWLFFAWHSGLRALVDMSVLWVLILATLVYVWRVRPLADALLFPYLLGVIFAWGLNYPLWQLNPQIL